MNASADKYWGKVPESELARAIEIIDREGWDAFTEEFKGKLDFTAQENRADWRFFVPLTKESVVLDVGAGLGRISIPLARIVKKVVACDASTLRTAFLTRFAAAKGLSNIEAVTADILEPPFPDESFDLIVMNGVLEWVGKTHRFTDPREAQIACLTICRRLLKKGGHLYVGIENRFAAAYLKGIDHSGLRFTSYMPRVLADLYTRRKKGHPYDTYTYTKRGYEKLFSESGFENSDFYLVYPGYNLPRILIPHGNLKLLQYTIASMMPGSSSLRRLAQLVIRFAPAAWLYRYVFFSFSIFARK